MDIETLALCKKELTKQNIKQTNTLKLVISLLKGQEYTTQLGNSPSYIQNVVTGAQGFAAINKIGGGSEYTDGKLIVAKPNKIISKSGLKEIESYVIPQALLDFLADKYYGLSAEAVYNYIDFESKKYIKKVEQIDLGTLTWDKAIQGSHTVFYANMPLTAQFQLAGGLTCKYPHSKVTNLANQADKTIWNQYYAHSTRNIVIRDDDLASLSATEFTSAMNGVMLNYEMTDAVEYDISQYISEDIYIATDTAGTITFEQENNTKLAVYNEIAYLVRVVDALGE